MRAILAEAGVDRVFGAIEHVGLVAAVEQAADGIVLTDTSGRIQYVNPAFSAMTGYTRDEVVGQNPRLLKSGRQSDAFYEELWGTIVAGKVWHGELANRRKDGRFYSEEMRISPLHDSSGVTTGYIAIKRDVTLLRAQHRISNTLAAIVESSDDAIVATTLEGLIHTWNRAAEGVFGYSPDEVIGKHVSILMAPERPSDLKYFTGQILQGINVSQYESFCLRKDGSRFHVSVSGSPVKSLTGEIVSMCAVLRDTSQHWQAEEKLRQSEARFRGVFDDAPVGIYLAGPDSRIIQVNKAFCRMLGYSREELLAKSWPELCHPDDGAIALEKKKHLHSGEVDNSGGETRYIHRNGALVWSQVRVSLLRTSDGSPLCSVVHVEDITERRRVEQALVESEHRFRIMADGCPIGIWVIDAQGRNRFVNRTYLEFCDVTAEQVEQDQWKSLVHPDDALAFFKELERALREHASFHAVRRGLRADGRGAGWNRTLYHASLQVASS
ncbi:MAG: PAS domain S-box protein [Terracidiphilus sp.]